MPGMTLAIRFRKYKNTDLDDGNNRNLLQISSRPFYNYENKVYLHHVNICMTYYICIDRSRTLKE